MYMYIDERACWRQYKYTKDRKNTRVLLGFLFCLAATVPQGREVEEEKVGGFGMKSG